MGGELASIPSTAGSAPAASISSLDSGSARRAGGRWAMMFLEGALDCADRAVSCSLGQSAATTQA